MELTEVELVRAIRKLLAGDAPGVVVPVGDDAAVVEPGEHHAILTADMLVEGVHFRRDAISAHDLGRKALTVNVSDVAAMGGSPRYGLASVGLPPSVESPWIVELYGGMREAADDYGMTVVGGDTNRAGGLVVSVAVYGEVAKGRAVTRSGARPGDRLVVTGRLGAAAGGLRLAQTEPEDVMEILGEPWARALVAALQRPTARVGEGQTLARSGATAMIDLSDGLALDLTRLCAASEVGARVRLADLPVAPELDELARSADVDPLEFAVQGGEDYELLATMPAEDVEAARAALAERYRTPLTEIGEVTSADVVVVAADGSERPLAAEGWDHFAR